MKRFEKNFVGIIIVFSLVSISATKPDIEIIKERVVGELFNSSARDDKTQFLIQNIQEDGTWSGIN